MRKQNSKFRDIEGELSARGLRFGLVVSRFNSFITERLLGGAMDALERTGAGAGSIDVVRVPGSLEMPVLVIAGSEFQRAAWEFLRQIPYGETRSYSEEARAMGRPRAQRAVGSANGDNRIGILIPCHRVIRCDGSMSGYGGGVWRKRFLLEHEKNRL